MDDPEKDKSRINTKDPDILSTQESPGSDFFSQATNPTTLTESCMKEKFRKVFELQLYGVKNESDWQTLSSKQRSSQLCDTKWERNLHILSNWSQKDPTAQKEFRRTNAIGFRLVKQMKAVRLDLPNGGVQWQLHKLTPNSHGGTLLTTMSKIFDAIYDAHLGDGKGGHFKTVATLRNIQKKYANIPESTVATFCRLCPVCRLKISVVPTKKEDTKPIMSDQFRDRFQIDFIDMRKRRKKNIYGTTMRWLLSVKDHFSRLAIFRAIPRKRPKYIAYELSTIFGELGSPLIFHTDKGNEFVAKEILQFLREMSPSITTVTGRPRKPSGQGSVENMNNLVKRVLSNLEEEQRQKGKEPNWTSLIGPLTSTVNSMEQRGTNSVSAYEIVYGRSYYGSEQCDFQVLRQNHAVEKSGSVVNSPRFDRVARNYYEGDLTRRAIHFEQVDDFETSSLDLSDDGLEVLDEKLSKLTNVIRERNDGGGKSKDEVVMSKQIPSTCACNGSCTIVL